jgi:tetratricopeptide (TPR) repeat protein
MTCPRCGFVQTERDDCARCGIVVARFRAGNGASGSPPGAPLAGPAGFLEPAVQRSSGRTPLLLGLAAVAAIAVAAASTVRRPAPAPVVAAAAEAGAAGSPATLPEPAWDAVAPAGTGEGPVAPGAAASPAAAPAAAASCPVDQAAWAEAPRPSIPREWLSDADGYARGDREREVGAPMLVYFYTDWCGYCRRLDERLLNAWDVERYLGERVVRVRVNPENGSAEDELAQRYGITGYPSLFLMGPDGTAERVSPYRKKASRSAPNELQAPEEFTRALEDSVGRQARQLLADAAQRRSAGDPKGALALIDKALALGPREPGTWIERAIARAGADDVDGALSDLRQAREIDGGRLSVYEAIDYTLGRQNRWAEAASCWTGLLERDPRAARAYYRRGGSYYRAGDRARALADAETACALGEAQACEIRKKLKG